MFDFIRTHQRLMQLVLLILIVPSFVLIGVTGYTSYVSGDRDLVKVGDSAVTQLEFDQARRQQLEQLQRTMQGGFDPEILENPAMRSALLESLINQRVVTDIAQANRFNVSDAALRQTIAAMPQLQENGRFSPERYNEVLASVGLTTRDFEQGQRAELAVGRVLGPVVQSAAVPAPIVQKLGVALSEQRTVQLREFPAADFTQGIQVSDADVKAWYDANQASLQLPQYVNVQYLLLNEEAAMAALPAIGEPELQQYYQQNKSRYVLPARVNVSHIQFNIPSDASPEQQQQVRAEADAVLERLKADTAAFAQVAREVSDDAGTSSDGGKLGWITRGSWPAALEEAVFALQPQQLSAVVQGPGGLHIFYANEVQPERGESFEEARAKVQAEVRRQLGAERFADMATQLTNLAYDNPASLAPAADALGLKVKDASGIARDRLLPAGLLADKDAASAGPDAQILGDDRVRRAAFSSQVLTEKQNSGVIEISPDTMIVLRVDKLTEPQVPALDLVADRIREQLVAERAAQAAQAAGQSVLAALKDLQKAPPTVPEQFGEPVQVSRMNAAGFGEPFVNAVFDAPAQPLPQYIGVQVPQGYVIARISGVEAGKPDAPELASLSGQLGQAWGTAEEQAVLKTLRDTAGVTMLPEADQVIAGEEPSN